MTRHNDLAESADYRLKSRDRRAARPEKKPAKTRETPEGLPDWISTYRPARHEAGWLQSSLSPFVEMGLITDVLFHIQGGKEASVYCCAAHPSTGLTHLAAKVYRPRKFRQLRNDKMYREGRETLDESGVKVKSTNHRIMRAIGKRTAFGEQVRHTSWLMYEYTTLQALAEAGVPVPHPHAASDNAILMDYIGDPQLAAPTLARQELPAELAGAVCVEVLTAIDTMLSMGMVHGDLSPYNLLFLDGQVTLIDFPQVTRVGVNAHIKEIFWRDVARVCDYFAGLGVDCASEVVAQTIWDRHVVTLEEPLVEEVEDEPEEDSGEDDLP